MKNLFLYFLSFRKRSQRALSTFDAAVAELEAVAQLADSVNLKREKQNKDAEIKFAKKLAAKKARINANSEMSQANRVVANNIKLLLSQDLAKVINSGITPQDLKSK